MTGPVVLRTANAIDYEAFTGKAEPACWFGLVIEKHNSPVAFGCVYEGQDGRWWVCFKGEPHPLSMQKGARSFLGFAKEQGMALHAMPDLNIPGSVKWMERWAFQETGETIEGHKVYKWTP